MSSYILFHLVFFIFIHKFKINKTERYEFLSKNNLKSNDNTNNNININDEQKYLKMKLMKITII